MFLLGFISIGALCHLAFISTRFSVSLYAIDKDASAFTVGVILSLFSVVPMLISVRIGKWIDSSGPFIPMSFGIFITLTGATLPLVFSYETADLAPLLVAACLVGTGSTFSILSMQQYLGELSAPEKRSAVFSWFAMGQSISGFLGPVLGGIIIDDFSHRLSFLLPIGVSVSAGLFLFFTQRNKRAKANLVSSPKITNSFQLFRYKELRDLMIITVLISMCWDLQNFVIPIYGSEVGLSASKIGFILGSFALATFAIRLLMPLLKKYVTEWQILISTLACAAVCFFIFPFLETYLLFMLIAFALGLGLGAAQPNIMTLVHSTAPEGRVAEALGLRLTIIHANQVALPLIFGAFGATLGTSAIFWIISALAFGGVLLAIKKKKHLNSANIKKTDLISDRGTINP
ncbi:MAG: MFS transporter [Proteobacteria bacterium]|nr:MFS transporter [Pseudomonadota bacterium]MDA1330947.1 MFS transporter [Pseudomonadota bacterium]